MQKCILIRQDPSSLNPLSLTDITWTEQCAIAVQLDVVPKATFMWHPF